jgi:hypothetical protein
MSGQGAMIGAAAGGIYGLASGKDPIKSAMMGAAIGGTGGAMGIPGLSAAGAGATAGAGTAAGSGLLAGTSGATTAANLTAVPAFGAPTFSMAAPATSAATGASTAGIFANPTAAIGGNMGMNAPGPSTGLIGSSLNQPSLMDALGNGLNSAGQYAQQNPYLTQMGMQSAQQMMQQPQAQFAPAGQIQRGGIQDVQIASALPQAPRISLI